MQKFINTIIHGDCIEEMKKSPNDSVDLIFADPPYYLQLPKGKRLKRADGSEIIPVDEEWDQFESYEDYDNFTQNWIKECQRILKPTGTFGLLVCITIFFRVGTIMQNLGLWFLNDVIWVKTDALPNLNGRRFTNNHETIIWSVKNKDCKKIYFQLRISKEN